MTKQNPELRPINVQALQCLKDGIRAPLSALARIANRLMPLDRLISPTNSETIELPVTDLVGPSQPSEIGVILIDASAMQALVVEGILADEMGRGLNATMNLIDPSTDTVYTPNRTLEVNGWYIMVDKVAPIGARCAAFYNGYKWRAKVIDICVADPTP